MKREYKMPDTKYMLIDVTSLETTKVVKVAHLREVELLGRLLQANGRKTIAPPLEGRGLSALDKMQLQYLYWNTCEETPPEDYAELLQKCLIKLETLPMDQTPLATLEKECERVCPRDAVVHQKKESAPKEPKDPLARPKATSTTGLVWEIADKLYAAAGNQIPNRKEMIAACVAEEINPATASTQFGKWKAAMTSKLPDIGS